MFIPDSVRRAKSPTAHPGGRCAFKRQVQIDAILDEQGNVIKVKVVSGSPLLYKAAADALKKWKYEPTHWNDQPIAVQMIATTSFVLGQ